MLQKMISAIMIIAAVLSCGDATYGPTHHTPEQPQDKPSETVKGSFANGADISWVTQMEADGQKFYGTDGKEKECTALMKELGFNAIRLRVWTDPEEGWCGKEDVLAKARRAQELGMRICSVLSA